MRFSTVFAVLTGSAMVFAGAVPQIAAKRSIADVEAACNFFPNGITPEFSSCGSNDTCVTTVVDQLVIAINNCTTALHTIPDGALPANETLADGIGNATAIIVEGFNELETGCNGQCSSLIALTQDLDFAISGLLTEVFKVVTGLKALVVSLLTSLLPTIKNLGLSQTLAVLS